MDASERGTGILVIGAGRSGTRRAVATLVARGAWLAGVCDEGDPESALELATRLDAAFEDDLDEALDRPQVGAAIVAAPPELRHDLARRALAAGKHVLCETPIGPGADEARALAAEADARRLRLAAGFTRRFDPPVRDALALLSRWAIGRTLSVRVEAGPEPEADGPEFGPGRDADALDALGPQACDLIRRFLGEVVAAKGYLRERSRPGQAAEREALGLFRDHDRGLAELRTSWSGERTGLLVEVVGSEGTLRVETAPWRLTLLPSVGTPCRRNYRAEQVRAGLFRRWHGCERTAVAEVEAFVAAIALGRPGAGVATGWDNARALEMVDAVRRSDWTGEEVGLDPLAVNTPSIARRRSGRRSA